MLLSCYNPQTPSSVTEELSFTARHKLTIKLKPLLFKAKGKSSSIKKTYIKQPRSRQVQKQYNLKNKEIWSLNNKHIISTWYFSPNEINTKNVEIEILVGPECMNQIINQLTGRLQAYFPDCLLLFVSFLLKAC